MTNTTTANDIRQHIKSGKLYRVDRDENGNEIVGATGVNVRVFGQRNGKDFGPIRYMNPAMLTPVASQDSGR